MDLACKIGSVGLIAAGTIVGAATLNPTVLGTISGAGLILTAFTEAKIIIERLRCVNIPIHII